MDALKKVDTLAAMIVVSLIALDSFAWTMVTGARGAAAMPREYFLDVSQGTSELTIFAGNIKIMTDAGPDNKIMDSLANILPSDERYIDIAIISEPQPEDFNGYAFMLDGGYHFGAFIYNGRGAEVGAAAWQNLLAKILLKNIPLLTLGAGDMVRVGGVKNGDGLTFLSPTPAFAKSPSLNETGFVEFVKTQKLRTLLAFNVEESVGDSLLTHAAANVGGLQADILAIGERGMSQSGSAFLHAVNPKAVIVGASAKSAASDPMQKALASFASSTKTVVRRTDKNGTITLWMENGTLRMSTERSE